MRILYSAFECNPGIGSDAYVGWSWAKQVSQTNEVHVLTTIDNKSGIEQWMQNNRIRTQFHFVSIPDALRRLLCGRRGYFTSYVIWQWYAYRYAKKLSKEIKFDVVHHVSIADFRILGLLWKLDIPFVYGPVGGGQETPYSLMEYVSNYRRKELFRSILNRCALLMPSYRKGIKRAAKVFVSNDETMELMKKYLGKDTNLIQMCELGFDREFLQTKESLIHKTGETVRILVSGRLMYRKGIELLLDACTQIKTDIPFVVDIYGGGHQEEDVKRQIRDRGLEESVILHGKVPFSEMPNVYAAANIFALPSLRETTGTAVIEAMANKLPVVALNQNGVKYLVSDKAGILADIGTKQETILNYAKALQTLIENEHLRIQLGNQGYELLKKKYTWEIKATEMQDIYRTIINKKQ